MDSYYRIILALWSSIRKKNVFVVTVFDIFGEIVTNVAGGAGHANLTRDAH